MMLINHNDTMSIDIKEIKSCRIVSDENGNDILYINDYQFMIKLKEENDNINNNILNKILLLITILDKNLEDPYHYLQVVLPKNENDEPKIIMIDANEMNKM